MSQRKGSASLPIENAREGYINESTVTLPLFSQHVLKCGKIIVFSLGDKNRSQ